jgi:spore maturation protein CgeB
MGHEVRTLGMVNHKIYGSSLSHAYRFVMQRLITDKPAHLDYKILRIARDFKPDVLLSTTNDTLHSSILDELGKITSGRRVLWWGDPPANSKKWGVLDPHWDYIYIKDHVAAEKLRLVGRNAHTLHEAMNPHWHKPLATQKNGSIIVAGNYYAFRQAILLRLMGDRVAMQLYGSPPPRWADPEIKKQHTGRYIVREEKSRIFGEGLACLNSFSLAEGDSLNCRAFEVAGAGGLQFIEYRPAIEECFETGKELFAFKSYEELLDLINRARKCPEDMKRIRQAGARRALAEHTYRHRLEVIFSNL